LAFSRRASAYSRSYWCLSKRGPDWSTEDGIHDFACDVGELFDQGMECGVGVELA